VQGKILKKGGKICYNLLYTIIYYSICKTDFKHSDFLTGKMGKIDTFF